MYYHDHILCHIILWLRQDVIGKKVRPPWSSQIDPCKINLHRWWCYNLNCWMKKKVRVCIFQNLYKEETPLIVFDREIWHHWLLKNNREIFLGSLILCGWLKNVLYDWLMLFFACIGISWWISLAYFGSIIFTCREEGDLKGTHWLGKPSSHLSNHCVNREWFYLRSIIFSYLSSSYFHSSFFLSISLLFTCLGRREGALVGS